MKVHCGYPDCDWEDQASVAGLTPEINKQLTEQYLMSRLLDHQVKEHGVPPAVWER